MEFQVEEPEELINSLMDAKEPQQQRYSLVQQLLIGNEKEKERSGLTGKDSDEFYPAEVVYVIDELFSNAFGNKFGFFAGVVYTSISQIGALVVGGGLVYLLTYNPRFQSQSLSMSLLSITIGTFVLMTGSSLIDHFEERHLNFQAYVHNAITFISAGVAILISSILRGVANSLSAPFPVVFISLSGLTNVIAGVLFVLSIWALLKLLWRLNQLIFWKRDYEGQKHVYSEIRQTLFGFFYAGGSVFGVILNVVFLIVIVGIVIRFTDSFLIGILVPWLLPIPQIAIALLRTELPEELKDND